MVLPFVFSSLSGARMTKFTLPLFEQIILPRLIKLYRESTLTFQECEAVSSWNLSAFLLTVFFALLAVIVHYPSGRMIQE